MWVKHSLTVSARQTAVSECHMKKRPCRERPEYRRMQQGELFLCTGHTLVPSREDVLDAEARGELVAIHPEHGRQLFRPGAGVGTKVGVA